MIFLMYWRLVTESNNHNQKDKSKEMEKHIIKY